MRAGYLARDFAAAGRSGPSPSASRAAGDAAKVMKRSTAARRGPMVEHIANQRRAAGRWRTGRAASRPLSSSSATAWREMKATPRPARAACLIAPLDPSVSVCGSSPAEARNSSLTTRVPEPGSRSSQTRRSSSTASTAAPPACGSSGAVMRTKSLAKIAVDSMRGARDVGAVVEHEVEDLLAVADGERQADGVVGLRERPHHRRDERLGSGRDGREAQAAIGEVGRLAGGAAAVLEQANDVRRERGERSSGGCGADAAALALRDGRSELARQRRHGG